MEAIYDKIKLNAEDRTVVTIGKFDGVHLGHRVLLAKTVEQAGLIGAKSVLLTFDHSPQNYMTGQIGQALSLSEEKRAEAEALGMDCYAELPFDEMLRRMEPVRFIREILCDALHCGGIVAGPDCRFGYRGGGTIRLLRELAPEYGYTVTVIEKERYRGEVISSSRIRECLSQGQITDANAMLGRPYAIRGEIVHGYHMGTGLGYPTINQLLPRDKFPPLSGVYYTRIRIGGQTLYGMSNIGRKPSVQGDRPVGLETHIFDFSEDVYGRQAAVELLRFIRPEQRFDSLEKLKTQIAQDRDRIMALAAEDRDRNGQQ